jgi:hypothetical protein
MNTFITAQNGRRISIHAPGANFIGRTVLSLVGALAIALAAPAIRAQITTVNAADALAAFTDTDAEACEGLLADLTGGDPATLLEGLSAAQAAELLELIAELAGLSAAPSATDSTVGKMAKPEFRKMARDLEERMVDHLWYGQMFLDVAYATPDKIPGQVVGLGGGGDSAIWSGHYLAAEAFRYALARGARDHAKNNAQAVVWNHEMRRAKARIDALVNAAHRNLNISKNWKAKGIYSPALDAEAGILFRNSFPEGVPSWQQNQSPNRHEKTFGPIRWDDGTNYFCQGTFTRDQYTGCVFGLLTAFELVGPDDPALRARIRDDLFTMTDYLFRHGWAVVRPENTIYDPTPAVEPLINGISWVIFMAQSARHAAQTAGTLQDQAKWEAIWTETFATMGPMLEGSQSVLFSSPSTGYYSYNLAHGQAYYNIRFEPNPAVRAYLRQCFSQTDSITKDDGNSHFEAITYALTGEPARLNLAIQHLAEWLPYYARWSDAICMSCQCGNTIECIPEDQVTYEAKQLDGNWAVVGTTPGTSTRRRSARILRIADERTPQDFLWQRSPYQGSGNLDREARPNERNAGVDFLLPYYLLRYHTEVSTPPYDRWPEFPLRIR